MKKTILLFALLLSIITVNAQEQTDVMDFNKKHHELKLNGVLLLVGAFEASYEYNLNEESSVGASIFIPISKDIDLTYFSPYYRVFFGKKYAAGFFIEGFGMVNNYKTETTSFNNNNDTNIIIEEDNITDFALGLGLGGKWITKRNFVFELNVGFGRNIFNNNQQESVDFVGKLGFNIGYRF